MKKRIVFMLLSAFCTGHVNAVESSNVGQNEKTLTVYSSDEIEFLKKCDFKITKHDFMSVITHLSDLNFPNLFKGVKSFQAVFEQLEGVLKNHIENHSKHKLKDLEEMKSDEEETKVLKEIEEILKRHNVLNTFLNELFANYQNMFNEVNSVRSLLSNHSIFFKDFFKDSRYDDNIDLLEGFLKKAKNSRDKVLSFLEQDDEPSNLDEAYDEKAVIGLGNILSDLKYMCSQKVEGLYRYKNPQDV